MLSRYLVSGLCLQFNDVVQMRISSRQLIIIAMDGTTYLSSNGAACYRVQVQYVRNKNVGRTNSMYLQYYA
jgi:hypothetical protein